MHGSRERKEHLLLDNFINKDSRKKKKNMRIMWIDYKKMYNSVPNGWTYVIFDLYKVDTTKLSFITGIYPSGERRCA